MDLKLQDKKALVISASKGIGKGVALALAKEGCHVLITSSNRENLEKAQSEIKQLAGSRVSLYPMNVRSLDSVKEVSGTILKEHPNVDILVTNGPGPDVTDAATVDESLLMNALVTNFLSAVTLCRIFLPAMIKKRFGRIIHLTSTTAKEPDVGMVLSNITRAAVMAYGKTLSREIANFGITVNTILTGGVQTERTIQLRKIRAQKEGISYEEVVRLGSKNFPVGYIATPEQFSQAVVFLASPLSEYINGVSLPIDGGAMRSM